MTFKEQTENLRKRIVLLEDKISKMEDASAHPAYKAATMTSAGWLNELVEEQGEKSVMGLFAKTVANIIHDARYPEETPGVDCHQKSSEEEIMCRMAAQGYGLAIAFLSAAYLPGGPLCGKSGAVYSGDEAALYLKDYIALFDQSKLEEWGVLNG